MKTKQLARSRCTALTAGLALFSGAALAQASQPLWELGVGVGAVSFPAYRGSDQRRQYLLPTPYVTYHGRWLRADRDGLRGLLWDTDAAQLTVSAALSPPAPSDRIRAREGMPNLKANFEIGPQLDVLLWSAPQRKLKLLLPLRLAHTLERQPRNIGWVLHPKLNLDVQGTDGLAGWNLGLQAGPLWGDKRQHQYFYGVAPEHMRADRPAYEASAGFAGMQYLAALSRRYGDYWLGAFVRYDNLAGARFADSPLVRSKDYWAAGVALTWVFKQSATMVPAHD